MGLGIREPAGLENSFVPGTSLLFDLNHEIAANPKHASGKEADLILVPQPSSSPRDPLVSICRLYPLRAKTCFRTGLYGRRT